MKLNPEKTQRQLQFIDKWIGNKANGTLEASTGFGKTYVGVLAIQKMLERKPGRTTLIIVPTTKLRLQWEEEIQTHKLTGVKVIVINTAVKHNWACSLLILDGNSSRINLVN